MIIDAVKKHPKLVEVTVGSDCSGYTALELLKGVLQKADVRKVDVLESKYPFYHPLSQSINVLSCEC